MSEPFIPDDCETSISEDGALVRVLFSRRNGDSVEVVIPRLRLPLVVSQLQKRISGSHAVPIDRGSLQIGHQYVPHGFQVRRHEGETVLTVFLELSDPERMVTLPLRFKPSTVRDLINDLEASLKAS